MTAPTMQLRIEKLKRRDLRYVLPIESVVFPEPWSVAVFNSELALRHGRLYRGAWDGHQLAGYIGFLIVGEEAHITTITVAPTYQRAGVASALIIDGIRTLLLSGVKHLSLEVAANNEPAQALYRRFGRAGRRPRELLPGHRTGRHRHVGPRHRHPGIRRTMDQLGRPRQ